MRDRMDSVVRADPHFVTVRQDWRLWREPATWLIAAVLLVDVRASSVNSELAWATALEFTLGVLALLILPAVLSRRTSKVLVWAIIGYALVQVPVMAWQIFVEDAPAIGTIGGPRFASALLAVAMPLVTWWLWPVFAVGLWCGQSYLAVTAAALGLLMNKPRSVRTALCVLAVAGAFAVSFTYLRPTIMLQTRLETWTLSWPDLAGHPWLGLGPGSWGTVIPIQQLKGDGLELWDHAHSELVQWAFEEGLVGLALFGAWVACVAGRIWTSPMRGSIVTLAVLALGLHVFHYASLASWLLLVLALGLRSPVDA